MDSATCGDSGRALGIAGIVSGCPRPPPSSSVFCGQGLEENGLASLFRPHIPSKLLARRTSRAGCEQHTCFRSEPSTTVTTLVHTGAVCTYTIGISHLWLSSDYARALCWGIARSGSQGMGLPLLTVRPRGCGERRGRRRSCATSVRGIGAPQHGCNEAASGWDRCCQRLFAPLLSQSSAFALEH